MSVTRGLILSLPPSAPSLTRPPKGLTPMAGLGEETAADISGPPGPPAGPALLARVELGAGRQHRVVGRDLAGETVCSQRGCLGDAERAVRGHDLWGHRGLVRR